MGIRSLTLASFVRLRAVRRLASVIKIFEDKGSVNKPSQLGTLRDANNQITWVVPPFSDNSGGHRTIFRFANLIENHGFISNIHVVDSNSRKSEKQLRGQIFSNFYQFSGRLTQDSINLDSQFYVATSWETVFFLAKANLLSKTIYLVQDFEPWFYPRGSQYELALMTYSKNLPAITAGPWLAQKLAQTGSKNVIFFDFCSDHSEVKTFDKLSTAKTIVFYARPETERRGFEIGIESLRRLKERMPEVDVKLIGSDLTGFQIPFEHKNLGVISQSQFPQVADGKTIGLVLSFTNLSLMPIEFFSIGIPVVSNDGENVRWGMPPECSILSDADPESLAAALEFSFSESANYTYMSKAGMKVASGKNWDYEAKKIATFIRDLSLDNH